jgi:exopolysaccharide biosynthesis polyprenyl glycosylphosphotransferase
MYYFRSVYFGRAALAIAVDVSCLLLASWIAWLTLRPEITPEAYAGATLAGIPLTFAALYYCDAYRPSVIGERRQTLMAIVNAMGIAFVTALAFYYFIDRAPKDVAPSLIHVAALYFPLLYGGRLLLRTVWSLPRFNSRVLIIGASQLGLEIANAIDERHNAGIELVGFLSDELGYERRGSRFEEHRVLGAVHKLEKVLASTRIDRVVVASKNRNEHFPVETLQAAKMSGCRIDSGIAFFELVTGKIYLRDLRASYLVFSDGFHMGRIATALKRTIDVVGSATALVLAFPVLVLAAALIKLDSKGPVFFRQERVGQGDKHFMMIKLRSMRDNAEGETGAVFTSVGDTRVTRIGHFLRRTRLDEVPQLWNILRGDMSLVGPRAERPEFAESLSERFEYYRLRYSVKPGLSGWAQTRYGYVNSVDAYEEKLALDLFYLKHRSLSLDLIIMWQTIKTVLLFRGM